MSEPMLRCDNCGTFYHHQDDLSEIRDFFARVAPGELMPYGECPKCGALVHEQKPEPVPQSQQANRDTDPPVAWLQDDEPEGRLDCGCLLTYDNNDGNAQLYSCRMHYYAEALLAAVRDLLDSLPAYEQQPVLTYDVPTRCIERVQTILTRMEAT